MDFPFRMRLRNTATDNTVAEKYDDKPETVVKYLVAVWVLRHRDNPVIFEVYDAHDWRPLTQEEQEVVNAVEARMTSLPV